MSVSRTPSRPEPRPGVLLIEAYVPGKSSAPGVAKVYKLSSNETPLGPSPKAIAAYTKAGKHLEDYPDGAATELREAIGRAFGLDPARVAEDVRQGYVSPQAAREAYRVALRADGGVDERETAQLRAMPARAAA